MSFHVPESLRDPKYSEISDGNNGVFMLTSIMDGKSMMVVASDGESWEHVSVSRRNRCPTWEEMCQVKSLFWDEEDCVVQFHPPKDQYVNNHPYCLHLWKPNKTQIPLPPSWMIGLRRPSDRLLFLFSIASSSIRRHVGRT